VGSNGYPGQSATLWWVMDGQLDPRALRNLTSAERQQLLRELIEIEQESRPRPVSSWKWEALLVVIAVSCVGLAAWTGYLAVALPRFYRTGSWRGAWVGFDIGLLAAFAITGWAAWRRRQLLIASLVMLATLLVCDAWFDVVLDVGKSGFVASLISAVAVELPVAALATLTARRLLHLTIGRIMRYEGLEGPTPPLWQIPLLGQASRMPMRQLMAARPRRTPRAPSL